jgi:hypothetical protein
MKQPLVISVPEIEEVLKTRLSPALREQCLNTDLRYEEITDEERDSYILEVVEFLIRNGISAAGEHRLSEWEDGWAENLEAFKRTRNPESLIPGYHGKHRLLHWKQRIIRPIVPYFDYRIHCLIVDWAIETYLCHVNAIYEFGCGPAYHLLRARRYNSHARLVGLEWAKSSQRIISEIVHSGIETNLEGRNFNFYEPDYSLDFAPNSGVLTVAGLEQVGERFEPFLQFLLQKRPVICVHLEPIDELMDQKHLIDRLSVLYCRKRNYLNGFLTRLHQLQGQGKVRIHREQRTYTGSFFIEGHSLVVWSPR